jgi:hypothetical protein
MSEPDEQITPLTEPAPIERVIDGNEVKLYRARAVIAYLDGEVYDLEATVFQFEDSLVPVVSDDGRQLGFATVTIEGTRVVADFGIDYASEERFLAETEAIKLYPHLYGSMVFMPMLTFDFHKRLAPTKLRIDGVVLSQKRPTDERVPALGKPSL